MIRRLQIASIAVLLLPQLAVAHWPADPSDNLVIADHPGAQSLSRLVAAPDGGFYAAWIDATSGSDVRLQRLDADGAEQWPHNGIVVADRALDSVVDYGLDVDANGDALLAFQIEIEGRMQVVASRFSPSGEPLWGTPGIVVSDDPDIAHSAHVAAIGDGDAMLGWNGSSGIELLRLRENGEPAWGKPVVLSSEADAYGLLDLRASGDGGVIVAWVVHSLNPVELWMQKFDADGAAQWGMGTPVQIYAGTDEAIDWECPGSLQVASDGSATLAWCVHGPRRVRVQRVRAGGALAYPANGVLASVDETLSHAAPSVAGDDSTGDMYLAWRVSDPNLVARNGVAVQRLDSAGNRMWSDSGIVLAEPSPVDVSPPIALACGGCGLFAWSQRNGFGPSPVFVTRIEADGAGSWLQPVMAIKTSQTLAYNLAGAMNADRTFVAFAWEAHMPIVGDRTLEAQAVTLDGAVGNGYAHGALFANGFD